MTESLGVDGVADALPGGLGDVADSALGGLTDAAP
jgi:hypothetical protein